MTLIRTKNHPGGATGRRREGPGQALCALALVGVLGPQLVFPLGLALAQPAKSAAGAAQSAAGAAQRAAVDALAQREAERAASRLDAGVGVGEAARVGSADGPVSGKLLDLTRPLTETQLRQAGGAGGALSPLRPADPGVWIRAGANAGQVQRLMVSNTAFATAINARNRRDFPRTAQLMTQFLHEYPDSPWAGEAMLHLGMDAAGNGRWTEAQSRFDYIVKHTSAAPRAASFEVHQKAKVSWANLSLTLGRWAEASQQLANILSTDTSWRRRTWALAWLREVSMYHRQARQRVACGTESLSVVFAALRKPGAARAVEALQPPRGEGFSMAELRRIGARYGVALQGFRARPEQLADLPLPLIIHYDLSRLPSENAAFQSEVPTTGHAVTADPPGPPDAELLRAATATPEGRRMWTLAGGPTIMGLRRAAATRAADASRQGDGSAFGPAQTGHFVVVQAVDVAARQVTVLDPQEHKQHRLTFDQLAQEWSGTGLCSTAGLAQPSNRLLDIDWKRAPAPQGQSPVRLSLAEMSRILGGCCCKWLFPGGQGDGPNNQPAGPKNCKYGSPVVSVNALSENIYITDTPFWYTTPVGPDVEFNIAYNSQDGLNHRTTVGNRWLLNYDSYLTQNPGGNVAIEMPGGKTELYYAQSGGGYAALPSNFKVLTQPSTNVFVLTFPDGTQYTYGLPNSNSTTIVLKQITDRWGFSLTLGFDSSDRPISITDAQSKVTTLSYGDGSTEPSGSIITVTGPTGKLGNLHYDMATGNLLSVTDMEGNKFSYTYNDTPTAETTTTTNTRTGLVTLSTPQGDWTYTTSIAADNGVPGVLRWMTTRVYNPLNPYNVNNAESGSLQRWFYDGFNAGEITYTDWRGNNTVYESGSMVGGEAKMTAVKLPNEDGSFGDDGETDTTFDPNNGQPTTITAKGSGRTRSFTYNAQGQVTSATDGKGFTTRYYYATNGLDLTAVVDATGRTTAKYTYNGTHQPTQIVLDPTTGQNGTTQSNPAGLNITTNLTYQSWGAPATVVETTGGTTHTTTYHYDTTTQQLLSVDRDGTTLGSYTYDSNNRVRTATDAFGLTLTYDYNNLDKVTRTTYPSGTYTEQQPVCCNLIGVSRDRHGDKTFYDYDQLKRLVRVQDASGHTVQYDYDANGNLTLVTDSLGHFTSYTYDRRNRLVRKSYLGGGYEGFAYDSDNNATAYHSPGGSVTGMLYDANNRLTKIDYPPATADVSFTYDTLGRVAKMNDGIGATNYTYDPLSRLTSDNGPYASDTINYTYDEQGRRKTMTMADPSSTKSFSYGYDGMGRLSTLTSPATPTGTNFSYAYADSGGSGSNHSSLPTQVAYPTGAYQTFGYDTTEHFNLSKTYNSSATQLASYSYTTDSRDLRPSVTWSQSGISNQTVNYTYDSTHQLTEEKSTETTPLMWLDYGYDKAGSRTSVQVQDNGGNYTASFTLNPLNQIASQSNSDSTSVSYTHDTEGNLTATSGTASGTNNVYTYDDANRLKTVIVKSASNVNLTRSTYSYDGLNRRRKVQEDTWNSGTSSWQAATTNPVTTYIYDGMQVLQERDGSNNVLVTLTRGRSMGGGIGGLLARSEGGTGSTSYYYHYDGSGNVIQLTDSSQAIVAQYAYDSYGNPRIASGTHASQPYRYSTKWCDTTSGLYDYGFRFYSPSMGRWLNRDPIRESGGLNLYEFVGNDPTNRVDDFGLRDLLSSIIDQYNDILEAEGQGIMRAFLRPTPDYLSTTVVRPITPAGRLGRAYQFVYDRCGNRYLGVGPAYGTPGASISVTLGYLLQLEPPNQSDLFDFITGHSLNYTSGDGWAVGYSASPGFPGAVEGGVSTPESGFTYTHTSPIGGPGRGRPSGSSCGCG